MNLLALLGPLSRLLTALLGPLVSFMWGRDRTRRKAAEDALQSVEEGRKGAADAKDKLRDGKSPQEIVDDNSGKWK